MNSNMIPNLFKYIFFINLKHLYFVKFIILMFKVIFTIIIEIISKNYLIIRMNSIYIQIFFHSFEMLVILQSRYSNVFLFLNSMDFVDYYTNNKWLKPRSPCDSFWSLSKFKTKDNLNKPFGLESKILKCLLYTFFYLALIFLLSCLLQK